MSLLLDWSARPVIAHRGNRAFAPENTLEAFSQAIALGADALEFDLRVSRDGVLVVMHDPTVDRTTSGHGLVESLTAAELRALDAGAQFDPSTTAKAATGDRARFAYRNRGIRVPLFDEVVELSGNMPLLIELKTPAATDLVRKAISHHGIQKRVVVAGFDAHAVHPLRGAGFPLGATTRDAMGLLPRALAGMSARAQAYEAVSIPPVWHGMAVPVARLARSLRATHTPLHIWTVNDRAEARRLWDCGVQGIISDDPAAILRERDK